MARIATALLTAAINLLFCGLAALARPVEVAGRWVELAPPAGYCELGDHPVEAGMVAQTRQAIAGTNLLLLAFGDCRELDELRQGGRSSLDNYGQVMAPLVSGQPRVLKGISRAAYVEAMGKALGGEQMRGAMDKIEERLRQVTPAIQSVEPLGVVGADANAVYFGILSTVLDDPRPRRLIVGVAASTLVKEMAISLNLYRLSLSPADLQMTLARQKVEAERLIRANE